MKSHLQKLPPMAAPWCSTANTCGRLRTVANIEKKGREQGPTPRPPELNENPSLRIREKGDILFFDDVHAGDPEDEKQSGTRCSVLKRSKNIKVTIMNLDLIKIVF